MKINCATSSRNVMLFIQRRTVGDAFGETAALAPEVPFRGAGAAAPAAAASARNTEIKPLAERTTLPVCPISLLADRRGACLDIVLRARRLAHRSVHQAFHRAHQLGRLVGALDEHGIRPGILLREPQR